MPTGSENGARDSLESPTRMDLQTREADAEGDGIDERTALAPGDSIGRHVVLRELGRGGMGLVYLAYDPELDRRVALKLVRPRSRRDSRGAGERLLREAQALARLSHASVVHVYDVGTLDDQVYIAMEFVEGRTLEQWCAERRRSWREVLDVLLDAGRGLAAAHAAGLVHLDFKPSNVVVADDGGVRVVDFGLAREPRGNTVSGPRTEGPERQLSSSQRLLGEHLTELGAVLGTPGYIAPEVMRGIEADDRADQFSFCVTAWQALHGERPFVGANRQEVQRSVLTGRIQAPPPGSRVPAWIRTLLERGLAVDRDARHAKLADLLEALSRDRSRTRRLALVGLAAAAVVGGGLAMTQRRGISCEGATEKLAGVWDDGRRDAVRVAFVATSMPYADDAWQRVQRGLDNYAQGWTVGYGDACEATHVRGEQSPELLDLRMHCLERARTELDALIDVLAKADADTVKRGVEAVNGLSPVGDCSDTEKLDRDVQLPPDPEVRKSVAALDLELSAAKALQEVGRYRSGIEITHAVVERAETVGHDPTLARALLQEGSMLHLLGDAARSEAVLERALFVAEAAGSDLTRYNALQALAMVVGYQRADRERGRFYCELARRLGRRLDLPAWHEARILVTEGAIDSDSGRFDEAIVLFQRALALHESQQPQESDVGPVLSNLGSAHYSKGDYRAALMYYERALVIEIEQYGPRHPQVGFQMENLANAEQALGEFEKALEHHRQVLAIDEALGGRVGTERAKLLNNIGVVLSGMRRYDEAAAQYEEALAAWGSEDGRNPVHAALLANLGEARIYQERHGEAVELFERALEELRGIVEPDHPFVAVSLGGLGRAWLERGEVERAIAPLERAVALHEANPVDRVAAGEARFVLARALVAERAGVTVDPAVIGRARELAEKALEELRGGGPRGDLVRAQVEKFLATLN